MKPIDEHIWPANSSPLWRNWNRFTHITDHSPCLFSHTTPLWRRLGFKSASNSTVLPSVNATAMEMEMMNCSKSKPFFLFFLQMDYNLQHSSSSSWFVQSTFPSHRFCIGIHWFDIPHLNWFLEQCTENGKDSLEFTFHLCIVSHLSLSLWFLNTYNNYLRHSSPNIVAVKENVVRRLYRRQSEVEYDM